MASLAITIFNKGVKRIAVLRLDDDFVPISGYISENTLINFAFQLDDENVRSAISHNINAAKQQFQNEVRLYINKSNCGVKRSIGGLPRPSRDILRNIACIEKLKRNIMADPGI